MIKIPFEEVIQKIKEKTGLEEQFIISKVDAKIHELSGLVSKEGASLIVANDFGVKLFQPSGSGRLQIKNILPGLKSVSFMGRVVRINPIKAYKTDKREGKLVSLLVADETGSMRVVFWDVNHIKLIEEGKLKEGDIIKIKSGYVRESKMYGGVEVHTSGYTTIEVNPIDPDTAKIPKSENAPTQSVRTRITDLKEDSFAEVRGAVVNIFESNPFFDICPTCNKRARDGSCAEHGKIIPKHSLVVSITLDDASSNIRVVLFGDRAEKVIGLRADEAYSLFEQTANPISPLLQQKSKVLGKEFVVAGKVNKNSFSGDLEMVASRVYAPDYKDEAKQLMQQLN